VEQESGGRRLALRYRGGVNDFARVASIIRYLEEHHDGQPALATLAAEVGLSASHFHRLFRRWAGITPKDFLQCLTAEHARQRLRSSVSVLETALEVGLSGPGRLHDLLVTLEAASPGEIKSGGAGLTIRWGQAASPFGPCTVGWNARGLCHLAFRDEADGEAEPPALRDDWPRATLRRDDREARRQARIVFRPRPGAGVAVKAVVRATPFQLRVWRALVRIPEGCVASYGWLAEALGQPGAGRAIGNACGSNPIAYLIPCHRVIRETGVVQGYRWGPERKRALLAWECRR
jgi:AraC family transcriptional regulator, regulatory protein of adaptative response / methylated-DNA-[protein]-cysteine methyltransferase